MASGQGGAPRPAGIRDVARLAGVSADRNVELLLPPPFPLDRLRGLP